MHKRIFLVDVLGSSSKITMKLNFQPFRTKIHYELIQNQLDIFELVKKLVKSQLIYANFKKIKNYFSATCLKQQ
jgi:histone deacetylase complex regulatory component SIN3